MAKVKRAPRHFGLFYIIILIITLLCIGFVGVCAYQVNVYLTNYEYTHPQGTAITLFNNLSDSSSSFKNVTSRDKDFTESIFRDSDYLYTLVKDHSAELTMLSYEKDTSEWLITVDDDGNKAEVLTFTLKYEKDSSRWRLNSSRVLFTGTDVYSVAVPSTFTVKMNGVALGDEYIVSCTDPSVLGKYLPGGVDLELFRYNIYSVEGFYSEPDITVFDAEDSPGVLKQSTEDSHLYICSSLTYHADWQNRNDNLIHTNISTIKDYYYGIETLEQALNVTFFGDNTPIRSQLIADSYSFVPKGYTRVEFGTPEVTSYYFFDKYTMTAHYENDVEMFDVNGAVVNTEHLDLWIVMVSADGTNWYSYSVIPNKEIVPSNK